MLSFESLYADLDFTQLDTWREALPGQLEGILQHGDRPRWQAVLEQLPRISPSRLALDEACLGIGRSEDISTEELARLRGLLMQLHPWRKGPFCLFDMRIDTEWRSDWKWARLEGAIQPLTGRRVLDVGCGNGYYGWRMLGAGAAQVIGVDPTLLFFMQFLAMRHFIGQRPHHLLPFTLESLSANSEAFDTVFSMGVLYHRKDPQEHLRRLLSHLRPGGELVLEGLVIEGKAGDILIPQGRYAKMRNVWHLPSPSTLEEWLSVAGFRHVARVDVSPTTSDEQRSTDWMHFESLADFLDPQDSSRTIEGYPAPRRAIFTAQKA